MSGDIIRQFYATTGQLLGPINEWRLAFTSQDSSDATRNAAGAFLLAMKPWESTLLAISEFRKLEAEWKINHDVWRHSGRQGIEPAKPIWPPSLPTGEEALKCMECIEELRDFALSERPVRELDVSHRLRLLSIYLDTMDKLLKLKEERDSDGPIDRNRLAELLGIQPKTLANRADELPQPIGRDAKNVPVYMYLAVRKALVAMYPDKEFMLPEYKNAISPGV